MEDTKNPAIGMQIEDTKKNLNQEMLAIRNDLLHVFISCGMYIRIISWAIVFAVLFQ